MLSASRHIPLLPIFLCDMPGGQFLHKDTWSSSSIVTAAAAQLYGALFLSPLSFWMSKKCCTFSYMNRFVAASGVNMRNHVSTGWKKKPSPPTLAIDAGLHFRMSKWHEWLAGISRRVHQTVRAFIANVLLYGMQSSMSSQVTGIITRFHHLLTLPLFIIYDGRTVHRRWNVNKL